jgi:ASC-1-like (ASCH) protein
MITHTLRFRAVNRDTFNAIKSGKKKVETRAAIEKYRTILAGDIIQFICVKDSFTKK